MTPNPALDDSGEFESVSEAELVIAESDTRAIAAPAEPTSRSEPSELRSSISGLRPSPAALSARLQAALELSTRTQATLAELFRTAKFLSASLSTAQETNLALASELELLSRVAEQDRELRLQLDQRVLELEELLETNRREAARERQFLLTQHDSFIAALIDEHEKELAELRERYAPATPLEASDEPAIDGQPSALAD